MATVKAYVSLLSKIDGVIQAGVILQEQIAGPRFALLFFFFFQDDVIGPARGCCLINGQVATWVFCVVH